MKKETTDKNQSNPIEVRLDSTDISKFPASTIQTAKTYPNAYRLVVKPNGIIMLQGLYVGENQKGCDLEWRDIPTVIIAGKDCEIKALNGKRNK